MILGMSRTEFPLVDRPTTAFGFYAVLGGEMINEKSVLLRIPTEECQTTPITEQVW